MVKESYSLERLADRAEIEDVMHRWCRAVDRLDFDLMRTVFHPDAVDSHGPSVFEGGVEELISWISGRHSSIPFCLHSLSNMLIEFAGPDTAVVETNVMSVQRLSEEGDPAIRVHEGVPGGHGMQMLAFARYADRFERRGGEWRIQHRVMILDSQLLIEGGEGELASGITIGRRDRTDYSYVLRSAVGL
ncbi:nuclear transport factor 2 family protein [Amycolatopsis sp.]|uniref:nuclear transport factor 2 family protein n=1 Tax=Amycolatopsis sp. TaxID=37632 RepID=UPI002DFC1BB7|nr:nuclear transport factor 2 family protein [Amycolatopsis sp.]